MASAAVYEAASAAASAAAAAAASASASASYDVQKTSDVSARAPSAGRESDQFVTFDWSVLVFGGDQSEVRSFLDFVSTANVIKLSNRRRWGV